jgi:hypothetical protein
MTVRSKRRIEDTLDEISRMTNTPPVPRRQVQAMEWRL